LDESPFLDTTDPAKPVQMVMITFQLPDGRVDTVKLPKEGYDVNKRDVALRKRAAEMGPSKRTVISF
jgi:hypothetical protein